MFHLDGFVLDAEHDSDDAIRIEETAEDHRRMPERELQERRRQQHDLDQSQRKLLKKLARFVVTNEVIHFSSNLVKGSSSVPRNF